MIFRTKFVNEDTYSKNGEEVEVLSESGDFVKVRFKDGTVAKVYKKELSERKGIDYEI